MAETAEYIIRGKEILAEQPKVVIKVGIGLHLDVIEGEEHISKEELDSLAITLRAAGVEGPMDEPIELLLSTEVEDGGIYGNQDMRDAVCSLIATTETSTGLKTEMSPGHFFDSPVVIIDGPTELWVPPTERLAKLALNHPWQAYEESQRGITL